MTIRRSKSFPSVSTSGISRTRSLPAIRPDRKQWFENTQPSGSAIIGPYQQFLQSLPPGFARYQTAGYKYLTPGSAQSLSRKNATRIPLGSARREAQETPLMLGTRTPPSTRHTPSQIPRQTGQSNLRSRARAVPALPPRNPVTPPAYFGRPPPPPLPPRHTSPPIPPRSSISGQPMTPYRQLSPPIPPRTMRSVTPSRQLSPPIPPRTMRSVPSRQFYPAIEPPQSLPPPQIDEAMFREMASKIKKENRNLMPDNRRTMSDILTDKSRRYSYQNIRERANRKSSMEQTMDDLGYYERRGRYYRPSDDFFETEPNTRRLQPQPGFTERQNPFDDNVSRTSRTSTYSRLPTDPEEEKYLGPLLSRYRSTKALGHTQLLSEEDQAMSRHLLSNRRSLFSRNKNDRRRMSTRTSRLPQTQPKILSIDSIPEVYEEPQFEPEVEALFESEDEAQFEPEEGAQLETYTDDENQDLLVPTEMGANVKTEKFTDERLERLRNLFLEQGKEIKKKKWYKFWK